MSAPEAAGTAWPQGSQPWGAPTTPPSTELGKVKVNAPRADRLMVTPTARMTFGCISWRLLPWGRRRRCLLLQRGKVPCLACVPGSCLLLTAAPPCWLWDNKGGGSTRRARGPVIATPCLYLCNFLRSHEKQTAANLVNFIWRTRMSSKSAIQVFPTALCSE